jgi:predicted ATP-dependent endonuclease of OLD family
MKRLSELAEIGKEERGERFQIIYSTHSPLLVNPSRFEQIRLFKREGDEDRLPETKIRKTSAKEICQKMGEELQENWNEETLIQKIQKIMNPFFNEGFFSELAVLVEGPTDRGVLLGMALTLGIDLEKHNIAVIPCNGKENLVLSALIFEEFGIKTYIIWDSDENAQTKDREKAIKTNKRLLRLCDATEEEDFPEMVHNDFACFGKEMDKKLKEEIGVSEFEQIMSIVKGEASLKHEDVYQNPELMQLFFKEALSRGKSCQFFQNIITKIIEKVKTK